MKKIPSPFCLTGLTLLWLLNYKHLRASVTGGGRGTFVVGARFPACHLHQHSLPRAISYQPCAVPCDLHVTSMSRGTCCAVGFFRVQVQLHLGRIRKSRHTNDTHLKLSGGALGRAPLCEGHRRRGRRAVAGGTEEKGPWRVHGGPLLGAGGAWTPLQKPEFQSDRH